MRRLAPLLILALSACGPERGAGVYVEDLETRMARPEAEYEAGETLGIEGLRTALLGLGISADEIAQVADPDHGIDLLELRFGPGRLAALDEEALARLALDSNFRLRFADPAVDRKVPVAEEIYRRKMRQSIAELEAHGDLDRVPRRRPLEPLAWLALRIEDWCGFEPGGALHVIDGEWLEYSHAPVDEAVAEPTPNVAAARFDCLIRAVYATQLRRYFIGYRGEPPPPVY